MLRLGREYMCSNQDASFTAQSDDVETLEQNPSTDSTAKHVKKINTLQDQEYNIY